MTSGLTVRLEADATRLRERFLELRSVSDIAELLETPVHILNFHLYRSDRSSSYRTFTIPKKCGGEREIRAPSGGLGILLSKLATVLSAAYSPRTPVHGFVRGRSIVTNAKQHVGRRVVMNVDIRNYFPSIHFGRVRGVLMSTPYELPAGVATALAGLCCYEGALAQGAPTSPVLSNMVSARLDGQLMRLCRRHKAWYTRYADDITISTTRDLLAHELGYMQDDGRAVIGPELASVFTENGFEPNEDKTRIQDRGGPQVVTGLRVNRLVNVPRRYVRNLRAAIHAIRVHGLPAAQSRFEQRYDRRTRLPGTPPPSLPDVLQGRIAFLGMVRGWDDPLVERLSNRLASAVDGTPYATPQAPAMPSLSQEQERLIKGEHAFVSYAFEDQQYVDTILCRALGMLEMRYWVASRNIGAGVSFIQAITRGLQRSTLLLCVVSEASARSKWVQAEVHVAESGGRAVIPIKLDDTGLLDVHVLLVLRQSIDGAHMTPEDLAGQIVDALESMREARA